ncbi:MAG: hypothetical protein WC570_02960 [Patescibacteria group bacterium]
MNRAKLFKTINLLLALVLLAALLVIVWLLWQSNQSESNVNQESLSKLVDQNQELTKEQNEQTMELVDDIKIKEEVTDKEPKEDKIEESVETLEPTDSAGEDSQDGSETKEDGVVIYKGVLIKASDDNEYGGNYKLINEGDTQYTYFWFDSYYAEKGVDNMVGKLVQIDVEVQNDGSFLVVDGPKLI